MTAEPHAPVWGSGSGQPWAFLPPSSRGRAGRGAIRRRALLATLLTAALSGACDSDDPVRPSPSRLVVTRLSGDGQWARPGSALPEPLTVSVRDGAAPAPGVTVRWEVVAGSGATVDPMTSVTTSAGTATSELTLGADTGTYRVRARLMDGATVTFDARSIAPPVLSSLSDSTGVAGSIIRLSGSSFGGTPSDNSVLFSGVRAQVLQASAAELEVEVPPCLTSRAVAVSVRVGGDETVGMPFSVIANGEPLSLEIGADLFLQATEPASCGRLLLEPEGEYVAIVQTLGEEQASRTEYRIVGLGEGGTGNGSAAASRPRGPHRSRRALFALRRSTTPSGLVADAPAGIGVAGRPPQVGDRREFNVLNADNQFDRVTAEARYVGERAAIYEDVSVFGSGLTGEELGALGREFDDPIFPVVTSAFGSTSDLDANERIIVLMTPKVNELTPPGFDGVVGGFFFGPDLEVTRPGSNGGEILYTLVPDPNGLFADPILTSEVLEGLPAVLAHELQHMIHYSERVLVLGAEQPEALWLSEALAQMAEDVVADAAEEAGETEGALRYRRGNLERAERYLSDPSGVSLFITVGAGSVGERGAGWLFARYLTERFGREILASLVRSTTSGVTSVTAATGQTWPGLLSDWSAALYLDGLEGMPPALQYPELDLRAALASQGEYALRPDTLSGEGFDRSGTIFPASSAYYLIRAPQWAGPQGEEAAVALTGGLGEPLEPAAGVGLRVVRVR